jgi:hypothetical protein
MGQRGIVLWHDSKSCTRLHLFGMLRLGLSSIARWVWSWTTAGLWTLRFRSDGISFVLWRGDIRILTSPSGWCCSDYQNRRNKTHIYKTTQTALDIKCLSTSTRITLFSPHLSSIKTAMIARLDSTTSTSTRASTQTTSTMSSTRSLSTSSSTTTDPSLMPRSYHAPMKHIDSQEDSAHNASINRHLLVTHKRASPRPANERQSSGTRMKGMLWMVGAARV